MRTTKLSLDKQCVVWNWEELLHGSYQAFVVPHKHATGLRCRKPEVSCVTSRPCPHAIGAVRWLCRHQTLPRTFGDTSCTTIELVVMDRAYSILVEDDVSTNSILSRRRHVSLIRMCCSAALSLDTAVQRGTRKWTSGYS